MGVLAPKRHIYYPGHSYNNIIMLQRWIGAPTALYGRERRFERSDEILLRHGCIAHAQIAQHAVE
jgi:hypothetical protein